MKKGIVWFKNDLRLHDNEALYRASGAMDIVYPLYIFDPREYRILPRGFSKTGPFRFAFLLETVEALRQELIARGSNLIVRVGKPEEIIPEMAKAIGAFDIYTAKEIGTEEMHLIDRLEENGGNLHVHYYWMHTLFHEEDVPWPIKQVPEVFTRFRKEAEKSVTVRPLFPIPDNWHVITDIEAGEMPEYATFGLQKAPINAKAVLAFQGGEQAAQERLKYYFWDTDLIQSYKNTRNQLLGGDYSSKFSPWLAVGALSAKQVYFELQRYEHERKKNSSTYWLFFELLWRDFFRFMAKKHGAAIYMKHGIQKTSSALSNNQEAFERWKNAATGEAFVDANMRELNQSGYMSNRGRQNAASFLIHDMGVNWTWGAAWFENRLLDYDPSSNWLNWAYIAGVGNDPQNGRRFNIESQAQRYDPRGLYTHHWLHSQPAPQ